MVNSSLHTYGYCRSRLLYRILLCKALSPLVLEDIASPEQLDEFPLLSKIRLSVSSIASEVSGRHAVRQKRVQAVPVKRSATHGAEF